MFTPGENVTEIIAHFIGYFHLRIEELRLRQDYEEFQHTAARPVDDPDLPHIPVPFDQKLELFGFVPGVEYRSLQDELQASPRAAPLDLGPGLFNILSPQTVDDGGQSLQSHGGGGSQLLPGIGPVPGSTVFLVQQHKLLFDDDTIVLGDSDYGAAPFAMDMARLAELVADGTGIGASFTDWGMITSSQQIMDYAVWAADMIGDYQPEVPADEGSLHFVAADSIEGKFVNGEDVSDIPILAEHLPQDHLDVVQPPETGEEDTHTGLTNAELTITPSEMATSMMVTTGGNLMVNEATLMNAPLTTTFIAVAGDFHRIDAIIQSNVVSDSDTIDPDFPGAGVPVQSATSAFNIASFEQTVLDTAGRQAEANPGAMPGNWQVSVVNGDLTFLSWLKQYNFSSDSDSVVMTATGTKTSVSTGENIGLNNVGFAELGLHYDLVIVGGSLFDMNIISQVNVLYDDDTIELLGDATAPAGAVEPHPAGSYNLDTSGNLLWNEASIHNIGATDWQSDIPDHYREAMTSLGAGNYAMPGGFGTDAMLEGFAALKVLFVTGNIFDMQYIQQVNVLGDADRVAMARDEVLNSDDDTQWNISTGGNSLINLASIVDYDTIGDTAFLGGQQYSDAMLVQAEMVEGTRDLFSPQSQGGELASELVAFLHDDDDDGPAFADYAPDGGLGTDGPSGDIMQSVLA